MSLILVVEPDSRHAAQLASIARNHLHAELVMADSGDRAVAALDHRVPDIVLTAPLLPHHDEAVLCDYLRALGEAGAHVQTLTIPILSTPGPARRSIRGRFRKERTEPALPDGCDPALFAEQVGQYLHRARQRRVTPAAQPLPPAAPIPAAAPAMAPAPIASPAPMAAFAPPMPLEQNQDEAFVEQVVAETATDDVDLTPFLTDLSEPVERYAEAEPAEQFDTAGRYDAAEPMPTFEVVEPAAYVLEPEESVEAVKHFEPLAPVPVARVHAEPAPFEPLEPLEPSEPLEPLEPIAPLRARVFAEPVPAAPPVAVPAPVVAPAARFVVDAPVEPAPHVDAARPVEAARPVAGAAPVTQRPPVRRADPVVPVRPAAPIAPPEPVAPAASFAQAPTHAELLPAVIPPRSRRNDRRREQVDLPVPAAPQPVQVPQVITVPANMGGGQTSVNVAVAVSVQVATQTTVAPAAPRRSKGQDKPVQDEWGFFDPDQCGFRALLARLDAIAAKEDED